MLQEIKRGQIYMANLGEGKGSIQGGSRPVIIINNQLNNKYAPIVNVLPITSKTKNNIPVHVNIGRECGLVTESTILTEQMMTLNKSSLTKLVGECSNEVMSKIMKAIIIQVSMQEDLKVV